jgi:major membrane immunogen (membrane-anchored lipoprotein)
MKRHCSFYIGCILCLVWLGFAGLSCARRGSVLKDGYYTAEGSVFDKHGWKEFVTICVNNGIITMVEYNAEDPSGFIRSWDMNYMRLMNRINGTYPNEFSRIYAERFITRQSVEGIDALSGATNSYYSFIKLAEVVLARAKAGDTSVALIDITGEGVH